MYIIIIPEFLDYLINLTERYPLFLNVFTFSTADVIDYQLPAFLFIVILL